MKKFILSAIIISIAGINSYSQNIGAGKGNFTSLTVSGNTPATFDNVKVTGLAGLGDRQLYVDAAGNLKQGGSFFTCADWNSCGNSGLDPDNVAAPNFLGTIDNFGMAFRTNNFERIRITAAGNIGIGTTNPQQLLEVNGGAASNTYGRFGNANGNVDIGYNSVHGIINSSQDLLINWYSEKNIVVGGPNNGTFTANHDVYLAMNSGNVGVATFSPYKKFTVQGDVSFVNYNGSILNSLEILGNDAVPTRRGISLDNDPNGSLNFYVHTFQSPSAFNFKDGNGNKNLMTIDGVTGKVGIGSSSPHCQLDVDAQQNVNGICITTNHTTPYGFNLRTTVDNLDTKGLSVYNPTNNPNIDAFVVWGDGRTGINATHVPAGYMLAVGGKVIAEEFLVKLQMNWPDYVFKKEYKLKSLKELGKYVEDNNHLPGIPSANEIEKSGISLGEIATKQMEKIEELTLYILQINNQLSDLSNKVNTLSEENAQLKSKQKK